jgi:hypothetical protein
MTPEPQPPDPGPPPLLNRVPPPLPENLNEVQRLTGVFVSPSKTFADIARRPRWWIPVILMGILSTIYINGFTQRVGWERMIRQQIEQSSRSDNMTAQQRQQAITLGAAAAKVVGYGAIVLTLFSIFVTAAILTFMVNTLMGGDIKFGSMMGIVSYGFLPTLLVAALSMLVMYLKPPDDFDLRNPLMFNAGAFVPADSAQWIKVLGASFDLFSFWIMALIAIGISAAAPKIPFGKALTAVIFPWALYVAIRTAATAAFG